MEYQIHTRDQIMHYIAVRLLNFKRIDSILLNELLCEKFGIKTAEPLFHELYQEGGAKLYFQVMMVMNEQALQQYLQPRTCQLPQLEVEEAF